MAKRNLILVGVGVVVISLTAGVFILKQAKFRGNLGPALMPVHGDIANALNAHDADPAGAPMPLRLPAGFSIHSFVEGVAGARVIAAEGADDFWVSSVSENRITHVRRLAGNKNRAEVIDAIDELDAPHGLAFDPKQPGLLYYAETEALMRRRVDQPGAAAEKVLDLPPAGRHATRTLGWGPDANLYVAIGSTCNVCSEEDARHASIMRWTGGDSLQPFAKGLRNAVFFAWDPRDEKMWATEMGRDMIGNDNPPEELDVVEEGGDYGWPTCYGQNVVDTDFDPEAKDDACAGKRAPAVEIQAHSAPLGLAVAPDAWGADWARDWIVAYHGSWNRDEATGYKLVRVKRDDMGNVEGVEDFVTGWLVDDGERALGRPVDVKADGDALLVSDDKAGVIYRITKD